MIAKVKFSKTYTIINALYAYLKLYMLKMTQNYIFEKVFVIRYMIGIDNIEIK